MPLSVHCPACQAKLSAPDSAAGKRVKCPRCQGAIAVPGARDAAPAPKPAAVNQAAAPQPAAVVTMPMPAAPAVPPAAAAAKSGFPVLMVLLLLGALGGGVLLVGAIGVLAFLLLNPSGGDARPAANVVATAGDAAPARSPAPNPTPAPATSPPEPAAIEWIAYENAAQGFKAVFPGSQPQPIDPLAQIEDPQQRELAGAMMKEWTVLGVTHGGRKYTLTAAPLDLGGAPPEIYLDRMSAGLRAIHSGFSLDPQPPSDKSAPIRDYVLKKDDAGKLLRVIAANRHVYQLLIEGEAGLGLSDPAAREFFERFECAGVSGVSIVSGAPAGGEAAPEEAPAEEPDGIDWRPLVGKKFAFTINFPGLTPQEEDPLSLVPENSHKFFQDAWARDGVEVESYSAQDGERRYGITVFRDPNLRQKGSISFQPQMENLTRGFAQVLYRAARNVGVRTREPEPPLEISSSTSYRLYDESKAIVLRAHLGHYGFVLRAEGPKEMDDLDPRVHKFFRSLQPPPDAAPIPLHVKPLPGPGPGGQPKAKAKTK